MSATVYRAYLQGALHDGTYNALHQTHRYSQKGTDWLELLSRLLEELGHRSWLYREGRNREVYVLETAASFLDVNYDPDLLGSEVEAASYVRGYFDAEGGMPRSSSVRFYLQLSQKNRAELAKVKAILERLEIACGKIHNPSHSVDPDYWRFYVRTKSHQMFARVIGSWHPRKRPLLQSTIPPLAGPGEPTLLASPQSTA